MDASHNGASGTSEPPQALNRPSCLFGVRCYRRNPQHRLETAHPGDDDFVLPILPEAAPDAPDCQYGKNCYRLNPKHFEEFKHPPETNVEENYKNYHRLKRERRRARNRANVNVFVVDDEENDSEDDPFQTDTDESDYIPSDES